VTYSEKSSIYDVHYALYNEPKVNIVDLPYSPNKGGSKTQNGSFSYKIALHLQKVCYKGFLCKYFQWQTCKPFTGQTIHAQMVRGEHPLLRENLAETDQPLQNADFQSIFARRASAITPCEKVYYNK